MAYSYMYHFEPEMLALYQKCGGREFSASEFEAATGIPWRRLVKFQTARMIVRTRKRDGPNLYRMSRELQEKMNQIMEAHP